MAKYLFSRIPLDGREVFYKSALSLAFVNLKPLVPGHVLVTPQRVVARFHDLTEAETIDLILSVRRVSQVIEKLHGATSLSLAIQDGPDAGQSVPHVHFHILPRRPGDWTPNDKVYEDLNRNRIEDSEDSGRQARSMADMEQEALALRPHFESCYTSDI